MFVAASILRLAAVARLEALAEQQGRRLPRTAPPPATRTGPQALEAVELWDLVSAFGRLMQETLAQQPQTVIVDHTPLHVHMDAVLEMLRRKSPLTLADLFVPPHTRSRLVGLFLAVLELAKGRRIVPCQGERCGEIVVALGEG